ncbi:hypothetical protein [Paenibacillus alvei]|uniref:Uncharacterized protein n=1 Tax=Paenibacillus alvei TaxID=44250 RepID=A0A383RDC0_PAEAL|nr:hypothetical protein [Paenibacillus alvei]SYX85097.1 protein of unknown function [Paenibacillus alvei]
MEYASCNRVSFCYFKNCRGTPFKTAKKVFKYWLYEDKTDTLVDYATVSGNHDEEEPVFDAPVDTNKKYRVEAQNKGNKTTEGTAYISY